MMRTIQLTIACLVVLIASAGRVQAGVLLLDHTLGSSVTAGIPGTAGWSFVVNQAIVVDGLGFFDVVEDPPSDEGIEAPSLVRLWDGSGSLLASTEITNSSTPVASSSLIGRWLFNDVTPITLEPGEYVVSADYTDSLLEAVIGAVASTQASITFGEGRVVSNESGGFGFPSVPFNPELNDAIFGPNIRGHVVSAPVPEPGSLAIFALVGIGMVGIGVRRKRI